MATSFLLPWDQVKRTKGFCGAIIKKPFFGISRVSIKREALTYLMATSSLFSSSSDFLLDDNFGLIWQRLFFLANPTSGWMKWINFPAASRYWGPSVTKRNLKLPIVFPPRAASSKGASLDRGLLYHKLRFGGLVCLYDFSRCKFPAKCTNLLETYLPVGTYQNVTCYTTDPWGLSYKMWR